jgi:hypothetical protein
MFGRQKISHVQQLLFALIVIIYTGKTECPSTDRSRPYTDNQVVYFSTKILGSTVPQCGKNILGKMLDKNNVIPSFVGGMQCYSWLRHYTTNWKVACLSPDSIIGIFH